MLFILRPFVSFSQTSKVWIGQYNASDLVVFDSSVKIRSYKPTNVNNLMKGGPSVFSYCSFNGDLIYVGAQYSTFNSNGSSLYNSNKTYIPQQSLALQTSDNSWEVFSGFWEDSTSVGMGPYRKIKDIKYNFCLFSSNTNCFDSLSYLPFSLYKTTLKRDIKNNGFVSRKMNAFAIKDISYRIIFSDVKRYGNYNYTILAIRPELPEKKQLNNSIGIYVFDYSNSKLFVTDSIILNSFDFLPDSMKSRVAACGHNFNVVVKLNRKRDFIFGKFLIVFPDNGIGLFYQKEVLFSIGLNKSTQKINGPIKIIEQNLATKTNIYKSQVLKSYNSAIGENSFSSNDSFLYLEYDEKVIKNNLVESFSHNIKAWNYSKENFSDAQVVFKLEEKNPNSYEFIFLQPNINPFGGITASYIKLANTTFTRNFIHLPNSNLPNLGFKYLQEFDNFNNSIGDFNRPLFPSYDYLRIKKSNIIYKKCGAYFSIKNISDSSFGLSKYKWKIAKDEAWTVWDSFDTKDLPEQFYRKSGKYLFKLYGSNNNGNVYSEVYIDTVVVNIPSIEKMDFTSIDTIVCKGSEVVFKNTSFSHDTVNERYTWDFGDNNSSQVKNPKYIYKKSGKYSIKLKYQNRFCDTTISKQQYISVKEAPFPGFKLIDSVGCAPITITLIDTVLENVNKKEYNFSDSNTWVNINLSNTLIRHYYSKPGRYYIKQRLTGYSGCVIQKDSALLVVRHGITQEDTSSVYRSTIGANGSAIVYWRSNPSAYRYQVLKNGNIYKTTRDTFFEEEELYTKLSVYNVQIEDSCGNSSVVGLQGRPILLEGKILGNNDSSNLKFSNYLSWKTPYINYEIQKLNGGNWSTLKSHNSNQAYTDKDFLQLSELNACYRIRAFDPLDTLKYTLSNQLCIPYIPIVYLPNAFSPNHDGFNDEFIPITFGIYNFKLTVLNAWGEIVFKGKENENWRGDSLQQGAYLVIIDYTSNSGDIDQQRSIVTLLK